MHGEGEWCCLYRVIDDLGNDLEKTAEISYDIENNRRAKRIIRYLQAVPVKRCLIILIHRAGTRNTTLTRFPQNEQ